MIEQFDDTLTESNDCNVKRLAGLRITDNDENVDPTMNTFPEAKMGKHKSTKCMLLKAFEARHNSLSTDQKSKSSISSTGGRRTQRETAPEVPSTITASSIQAVESYFLQHATKFGHGKTSSRTLSSLCTGGEHGLPDPLTFERFIEKWKPQHSSVTDKLLGHIEKQLFPNWPFYLREGFNILLYGVGSKRQILDKFREHFLSGCNSIVIPGYDSAVNIRQILNAITDDWLQLPGQCKNPTEQIELITKMLNRNEASKAPLYLLLHNIDGPGLRNAKAQSVLAQLASLNNVHLIASVDHINMPILWSHNELARFSWIWEDCTSLADYKKEASYTNSLFLQNLLGGLAGGIGLGAGASGGKLASLRQVAASLTQNARDIFRMIAEHQLNAPLHETRGDHVGMPLEDLYWRCRDAFLTNSEATLRVQLTEFRDHKLIKMKKGADGTELLVIPMDKESLSKFLENFDSFC